MSTSLAEQLQRLAVPQTSTLQKDKKRASILFEPKDAAGLKRETVYQIGLEGLEELIQKNDIFKSFENTLFHITSKDFERSVQTQAANDKLNKNISDFLLLLSPYFLLNCSQKCLEWLVNRFHIHEYNREDVLLLILPYHESNIFVRVLQLLKFRDVNDSFYFLKALQKPGVHLPKQSLINQATSSSGFLKYVTKYILKLIKIHKNPNTLTVAFNFYTTVFLGTLEHSERITEDQISQMLPVLLKGLDSTIPDFCAGTYVIVARLVSKTNLSDKLLEKFVEKISQVSVPSIKVEATLVLVVLYQSQSNYSNIPSVALSNFWEKEWLPKTLQDLRSSGCFIDAFLGQIFKQCAEEAINNSITLSMNLITNLLDHIKLDEPLVTTFLYSILDAKLPKTKLSEDVESWLTGVLQTIERQYPSAFDREVCRILSTIPSGDKVLKRRKKALSTILKKSLAYRGKFDIFEKLYHPNPQLRSEAMKYLLNDFKSLKDTEQEIIKNSFIDRLYDDNVDVVKDTLAVIAKTAVISRSTLRNVLIDLAVKCRKQQETWGIITGKVLQLLCCNSDNDWLISQVVLPFLLPATDKELQNIKNIIDLPFISEHELFKRNIEQMKLASQADEFEKIVFKSLAENSSTEHVRQLAEVLRQVPSEKRDIYHTYTGFLLLTSILPQDASPDIGLLLLYIFNDYHNQSNIANVDECSDNSVSKYIEIASKEKIPIKGFLQCLANVISRIKKPESNICDIDFSEQSNSDKFFLTLTTSLLNGLKLFRQYTKIFFTRFFEDLQSKIDFLLNFIVSENRLVDKNVKANALSYIRVLLKSAEDDDVRQLIYSEKYTAPWLLILLSDHDRNIRERVFQIISILTSTPGRRSKSYLSLLEIIQKSMEEILIDEEQVPLVIFNILDPTTTKSRKNSAELNNIRNYLVSLCCSDESPLYLRTGVLKLLSLINTSHIVEETSKSTLKILQDNVETVSSFNARIVDYSIKRIEPKVLGKMKLDSFTWDLMEFCLKTDKTLISFEENNNRSLASLILNQLDKELVLVLEDEVTKKLLDLVVSIATTAKDPEVLPTANRFFKHIDLDANLIIEQLLAMRDVQSPKLDVTKKKRRVSVVPTADILDTLEWKKGLTVLEFIQDKKKIRNTNCLLQVFFELLKRCLDFDEQAAVEYPKQLLLSSILHCCEKCDDTLPDNVFNVEIIVQCIRASQNPQTHHHALLVLAHTANLIPTQVLHHMMAIFTFMGSSILRHDDAYSFQIITRIIDTIIPILVQSNEESEIAQVLRVFVDAILDVPEHRRMPLYKQLLEKMDAKENLYIFLLLIAESQVLHSSQLKVKDNAQKRLHIATNLCYEFSPSIVIYNTIKLMKYLNGLPDEKEEIMDVDNSNENGTFNISAYTPKDFRHYKYILMKFCSNLLSSQEFVSRVATLSQADELALEDLFKESIITVLQFIQRISKVTDKAVNTPQAQYWKVVLHLSYDILDSINALVTGPMFLLITRGLMVHKLNTVRRRILELLNSKLQYNLQFFEECDKTEIYSLIPTLVAIVEDIDESPVPDEEIIIQTALLSLKLLVKSLASKDPEKFVQILEFITNILKSGKAQNNVLASVLLCLAELCVNLKAHAIGSLPDFMPIVLRILKNQKHSEKPSVILRSIITTVEKIFDSMPLFLGPYLEKVLVEVTLLISKWSLDSDEQNIQPFISKLRTIKQKIGSILPIRILLPAIEESYNTLINKKYFNAISPLMDILAENLTNLKGSEINTNLSEITNFFLNALKFRAETAPSLDEANEVESHIVKALTVLILKLSESSFRPLYYRLYDWAVRSEDKSERLITFYSLSSGIAQSLKGLFALFAGHFINNATQILDACNKIKNEQLYFDDDKKDLLLLEHVLKTLNAVFMYDSQKFINKDRFDILMQPLVDQLENTLGGIDELCTRNKNLVTPCLVHFAMATADDALWKQMNYQILLKMRHNEPQIRLVTLHCLTELVTKLGEDFLPLLPETIPFLSELLEDEEQDVEKACQKAVQEMEKVLGEPLQKYF